MDDFGNELEQAQGTEPMSELKRTIHEALDERDSIDRETHHVHHEFIEELIEKYKKREARREKMLQSFLGTLATALVGALVWVGNLILEAFKTNGTPGQ